MPGPNTIAQRIRRKVKRWRSTRQGRSLGTREQIEIADDGTFVFRCNLCGAASRTTLIALGDERESCDTCGSVVRFRAIGRLVTQELFGDDLVLTELPSARHIRGIGLSDACAYARPLARRLGYVNTFLHAEPRLDIANVDVDRFEPCDFIIASDVFEHVAPPVSRAFANVYRLLKPGGKFIFTVPFSLDDETVEHFPALYDWQLESTDGAWRLVNQTADGRQETHDHLVFHGGPGTTLEMRLFSRAGLEREFAQAGFSRVRIASEAYLPFGIHWEHPWSLPMVAYR